LVKGFLFLRSFYERIGTEVFTKTDECIKESLNIFANIYKNILGSNEETYYSYLIKEE
jgi:hypothetical protein